MPQVLLAEFDDSELCARAVRRLVGDGHSGVDVHMPYPDKNIEEALHLPKSPLPWWVLGGGLVGAAFAYWILWWTQHVDYPLDVAGHPTHSAPAFIGITFETTVLFASISAFFGLLSLCGLPRLHHPLFEVEAFARASIDRFLLTLPCDGLDEQQTRTMLSDLGALSIDRVSL